MNIYENEPFAEGFMLSEGSVGYRIACGLRNAALKMPLENEVKSGKWYADARMKRLKVYYAFGGGIAIGEDAPDELRSLFEPYNMGKLIWESKTEIERDATIEQLCWGGDWCGHSNPDYGKYLHLGTDGIREKIAKYEKLNGKSEFYESLYISLDALDILAERFGALAVKLAEESEGEERKLLLRQAEAFSIIPRKPPRDFFEACLAFFLLYSFDGIDSPGRFDMFMGDYYDISTKKDEADARLCLGKLWEVFKECRAWNLCIGGSDSEWRDETNQLTYAVLDVAEQYGYNTPNLTMRVHRNTPQKLLRRAIEVIGTGIGMPALYNDEVVCPALEALGIPFADAHEYCMNGCNQIDIMGKSHMGLEDGEVSLIKCLELAENNGCCRLTGKRLGPAMGIEFDSFDKLFDAFKEQIRAAVDKTCDMANKAQELYATKMPNPLRSCFIEGCIEKARDYKAGGPLYNHGQILTEGFADAVDSLAAIKHFCFDKGAKVSYLSLLNAMKGNFEGEEMLRQLLLNYEKFGNNREETDRLASEIFAYYFEYLLTKKTYRGGIYGGGLSTFNRTGKYGRGTASNANGRTDRSIYLADSIGAEPGCDRLGPTAALSSVLALDQKLAKSGLVMNIKFQKELYNSEKGRESVERLIKSYFEGGGQQLSLNVVSTEELIEAQKSPEKHGDLIVRVGGYSEYFVALPPELQNNIIKRSEFAV